MTTQGTQNPPPNTEKVEELRQSAQLLAKQALETAELGLRLVRTQFDTAAHTPDAKLGEVQRTMQNTALNVETKAKEMFSLATSFLGELNEKWQPGQAPAPGATAAKADEKPKPEKINIDVE